VLERSLGRAAYDTDCERASPRRANGDDQSSGVNGNVSSPMTLTDGDTKGHSDD
jgi:hypothetical protein